MTAQFDQLVAMGEATAVPPTTDSGWETYLAGSGRLFLPAGTNLITNPSFEKFAEKVVFDGDSHTARWEYPVMVMDGLGNAWSAVNQATSGHTSQDVIDGIAAVDALYSAGDVYVLWIGTNDYFQSFSTATTIANIASICAGRQAVGYKVIVCTVLKAQNSVDQEAWRDTVNNSILANWATYADGVADIGNDAILGADGICSNPTYFDVGQVHLMEAGNVIAAGIVQAALEALPLTSVATGWTFGETMDNVPVPSPAPAHAGSLGHVSQRLRCVLAAGEAEAAHAVSLACPFSFFDIVAGTSSFAARVSVASTGVPTFARLNFGFYNSAWGNVGNLYTDLNPVPATPTQLVNVQNVPGTAVRVYVYVQILPLVGYTPGQSLDASVDDFIFGDAAGPYFDGSYPDCAWTGAANASTSTRTVSALEHSGYVSIGSAGAVAAGTNVAYFRNASSTYYGPGAVSPSAISATEQTLLTAGFAAGWGGIEIFRFFQNRGYLGTLILPLESDGIGYLVAAANPMQSYVAPQLDDTLWQILAGDNATGWRDVTDECGGLVYSTVMPGGPASASCTLPADVWGLGYNEVRADQKLVVRYAGRTVWSGIILPRGVNYQGE